MNWAEEICKGMMLASIRRAVEGILLSLENAWDNAQGKEGCQQGGEWQPLKAQAPA